MTDDTVAYIAIRRRYWQLMPPEQRFQRIQAAVLDTIEIARWRRQQRHHQVGNGRLVESSPKQMEFFHEPEPN